MATYDLMRSFIEFAVKEAKAIKEARDMEWNRMQEQKEFTLSWKVDSSVHSGIPFKGYEAKYKPSEVSAKPRLYYDRNQPYTKTVPFYDTYLPVETATAPEYYVLPAGWNEVVWRLQLNGVDLQPLSRDTTMELTVYHIKDYETVKQPFEGHYLHTKVSFGAKKEKVRLLKGDYLIPVQQKAKRYLLETLEPNAPDAFFAWNFFDAVLQQKEHFSDYVFEDEAAQYLNAHPALQRLLDEKRAADTIFARDGAAQLEFVYRNSPFLEPEYKRYPVFRID
jgi:hypothetical protein